jgi:hypothetical protein
LTDSELARLRYDGCGQCAKSCRLCCVSSYSATVPCLTAWHGHRQAVRDWLLPADMRRRCRPTAPGALIPRRPRPLLNRQLRQPPPTRRPPPRPLLIRLQPLRLRNPRRRPLLIRSRHRLLQPPRPLLLRSTCRYERHAAAAPNPAVPDINSRSRLKAGPLSEIRGAVRVRGRELRRCTSNQLPRSPRRSTIFTHLRNVRLRPPPPLPRSRLSERLFHNPIGS